MCNHDTKGAPKKINQIIKNGGDVMSKENVKLFYKALAKQRPAGKG